MRLAFIGGCGHHYLRGAIQDTDVYASSPVPVAGDGYDNAMAKSFAGKIANARWFDDPYEMLDSARPDVVSIGAVYAKNAEFAAAALERDIAVVSDKPIAASWEDLRRIRDLTEGTNRVLLTEFPFRAQPEFRAMRNAVSEGAIGSVVLASAQKSYKFGVRPIWYADRALYGGTLLWVASHGIDAMQFVTGQQMECVFGRQGNLSQPNYGTMEDYTVSGFALAGGGAGIVHADYLRASHADGHGDDRLRLAGSQGTVEVRNGRCFLNTHDAAEKDITRQGGTPVVYKELLAALNGEMADYYSTAASLETAALLLSARDAGDHSLSR